MLTHAAICRGYNDWADVIGLEAGDRYLIINPFFHSFGLNAGVLASLMKGATMLPHPVFDVAAVMERVPVDRITMLPGPPAIYQTILNHPDLDSLRPVVAASRGHRRGDHPGRDDPGDARPARLREGRDRLRPHRGVGSGDHVSPRRRSRDHRHHVGPGDARDRGARRRRRRCRRRAGHARRGRRPGLQRHGRLSRRSRTDRRDHRRRRMAPHRRHRGDGSGAATSTSPTARRTCSSTAGSTCIRPRSRTSWRRTPTSVRSRWSGSPTTESARSAARSWSRGSGTDPDPDAIRAWCRDEMANYKVPRRVEIVDDLPLNASGKVLKYELRDRVVGA